MALACSNRESLSPSVRRALQDPMLVAVDGLAPSNGFDGLGSLFLGDGWGRPEGSGDADDWGSMAWVVGREAVVHLFLPPDSKMDFFARCLPYPWDAGAPQQSMELLVGNQVVGRVELVRDWQDVRMPLPEGLPKNHLINLRLRFAHALKPSDDARSLAAAFTQLAAVPRAVQDPKQFLEAHAFDPESGKVTLPSSGGLRLPLPAASHIRLQLTGLAWNCRGCELSLDLAEPTGALKPLEKQWRQETQTVEASFDTGPRGIHSLWIRVSQSQPGPLGRVEFVLGPLSAGTRRRAWWRWDDSAPSPHIFLYMIDTLRADELAPYGGRPELAPHMNAFASEAVTYLQARAPSSWTLPSVVSLLTGLYSDRHGVMAGNMQYDPQRAPSLQRWLGERGYRTLGISHSFIVSAAYRVDASFGSFYFNNHLNGEQLRSQEARGLLALWLSQHADGSPIFAYLHTVDPHAPYTPPAGFREAAGSEEGRSQLEEGLPDLLVARGKAADPAEVARLRALYDGEVRYTDRELGRFIDFLKWLGLYEDSFVILVSDHGEEFAEHGGFEHGWTVFEEVLRVPLIVKYPGGRWAGERIETAVNLVDIAPTLLAELAGAQEPDLDGRVLPGPSASRRREQAVYVEVVPAHDPASPEAPVDLWGLVSGDLKCIENRAGVDRSGQPAPRLRAFNISVDPGEQRPLAQDSSETTRCRQLLAAWSASRERQVRKQRSRREATPETLERLRALGYLQ
jgi:arylsulfatase A-like enzyme